MRSGIDGSTYQPPSNAAVWAVTATPTSCQIERGRSTSNAACPSTAGKIFSTAILRVGSTQIRTAVWLTSMVVVALALALPAIGEASGTGSIAGSVTQKGNGRPLGGVEVCAESMSGGVGAEFGCGVTGLGGTYKIAGLGTGQYRVEFWARPIGYVDQIYDGKRPWEEGTPVPVVDGAQTPGINAQLERGATISGTVTAVETGAPVAKALVCASTSDESEFGCGVTDSAGSYAIKGLAEGQYEVFFSTYKTGLNLLSQPYELGLITLAAGIERTEVDAALLPGGQIGGTVRAAATGAPLAGVEVCLTEASEAWPFNCLKTAESGGYNFIAVPTGSFKVVFSPEASELSEAEEWGLAPDGFPTQWWNGQPSFAAATPIALTAPAVVEGIDGSLGPGPVAAAVTSSSSPAVAVFRPKPKPLKCRRGFVKRKVKGKARCVKRHRHKAKRHGAKHRS